MRFENGTHNNEIKICQTLFDIISITDEHTNVYVEFGYRERKSYDRYEDWVDKLIEVKKFFDNPNVGAVEIWANEMDVNSLRWSKHLNALVINVCVSDRIEEIAKNGGFDE